VGEIKVHTDEVLKESIHETEFQGLKVFFMPKKGFRRKYAEIFVRYGSNDNSFVPPGEKMAVEVPFGIAHFLEHKMFEKPWGEAFSAFARLGGSANAFTSNNYTSYLFWTVENFPENLRLLFEVVTRPYFTDESVRKEQGIIAQEIRMYKDEPASRLLRETLKTLFLRHPVRVDVAGTEESIREIKTDLLYLCHRSFYCPENMALFAAGDMQPEVFFRIVEGLAREFLSECRGTPRRLRPSEPPGVGEGAQIFLPVPTPLIEIGWKVEPSPSGGKALVEQEVSGVLLLDILFGKSSAFFTKVYEMGLVDDLSYSYEVWPDYAFGILGTESPEPEKLWGLVHEEIRRVKREGFPEEDFHRVKRAALGRYVTLFDSFDSVGEMQVHLSPFGQDVFSYGRMLDNLTLDQVTERLREFSDDRLVRVIVRDARNRAGK